MDSQIRRPELLTALFAVTILGALAHVTTLRFAKPTICATIKDAAESGLKEKSHCNRELETRHETKRTLGI
jgi:hypothetical protein